MDTTAISYFLRLVIILRRALTDSEPVLRRDTFPTPQNTHGV